MTTLPHGVDVASHQGQPNWAQVAASGRTFAFTKATGGSWYRNPTLESNAAGIQAAGLQLGYYHYAFELSGDLFPGGKFAHTFADAGTYAYHCTVHDGMIGEVDVSPVIMDALPVLPVPAGNKVDFQGRTAMEVLEETGMLDLDPDDREVVPGVRAVHAPGHTPGHRSVIATDGGASLLLTGDLLHVPFQIAHPDWPSGHDRDADRAAASRVALLDRARDGGWSVAVGHFGAPFGRVVREGGAQRWASEPGA